MQDQFARLGVAVELDETEEDAGVVTVWDINKGALEVFLAMATQWRVVVRSVTAAGGLAAGRMVWLGLDYAALDVVLRRFGHDSAEVFADVMTMETAAIDAFDEAGS